LAGFVARRVCLTGGDDDVLQRCGGKFLCRYLQYQAGFFDHFKKHFIIHMANNRVGIYINPIGVKYQKVSFYLGIFNRQYQSYITHYKPKLCCKVNFSAPIAK
jgi:hypothetical protein